MSVQSTAKLFENLRKAVSKNSYLMQFCEKNICQVIIFRLYAVYNKHEIVKIINEPERNAKHYQTCSNNFTIACFHNNDF